jgi:hypothetical protein
MILVLAGTNVASQTLVSRGVRVVRLHVGGAQQGPRMTWEAPVICKYSYKYYASKREVSFSHENMAQLAE